MDHPGDAVLFSTMGNCTYCLMGRFAGLARAENGGRGCFKSNEGTSELNYTTLDAMNSVTAFICFCVTMAANLSWAQPIVIDWQEVGGVNMFERQAVTFTPIQVDSFDFFQSDGLFFNLGDTSNSSIKALIYIYIGERWELFAENDKIQGPYHSFFSLHDFVFFAYRFLKRHDQWNKYYKFWCRDNPVFRNDRKRCRNAVRLFNNTDSSPRANNLFCFCNRAAVFINASNLQK